MSIVFVSELALMSPEPDAEDVMMRDYHAAIGEIIRKYSGDA